MEAICPQVVLCKQLPLVIIPSVSRQQFRYAHTRRRVSSTTSSIPEAETAEAEKSTVERSRSGHAVLKPPLSILPLSSVLRSWIITGISSYSFLLRPSLGIMSFLAHSKSPLFNPERNAILRYLIKKTFYAQFCAGETPVEVKRTVEDLKRLGYSGVILGYGREVVMDESEMAELKKSTGTASDEENNRVQISEWEHGTLETVRLAKESDFVALKFSGAGQRALHDLSRNLPPEPLLEKAIVNICETAKERNVGLLFDAEQDAIQKGIDSWTLNYQRKYNQGSALVYGTYQAYLKSTPTTLAKHLATAQAENFTLGVKLVRGAYIGSDPRHLMWGTKDDTDKAYNSIAECLMRRTYEGILKPVGIHKAFPRVDLVLASHNSATVERAQRIRNEQVMTGERRIDMVYGQLMGMADNISCSLVAANQLKDASEGEVVADVPKAYKYLVWGTVGECTKYLLRRAEENRDAVSRTQESRKALTQEVMRRVAASVGLSR